MTRLATLSSAIIGIWLLLCASGSAGASAITFKYEGHWGDKAYDVPPGLLVLDISGSAITGFWKPLIGYTNAPIAIKGSLASPDKMSLEFKLPHPLVENLVRSTKGNVESWSEVTYVHPTTDTGKSRDNPVGGVWAQLRDNSDFFAIIPDGPAAKAGIRVDDTIVAVDGVDVKGQSADFAATRLRGRPGTKVTIRLLHAGGTRPFDVTLTRALLPAAGSIPPQPDVGNEAFWRYRDGDLSEAALTLAEPECGYSSTALAFELNPGVSRGELSNYFQANPDILQYGFYDSNQDWRAQHLIHTTAQLLKDFPAFRMALHTPVGSEVFLAQRLRRSGLFASVELVGEGCGGGERSAFILDKKLIYDASSFSPEKLVSLVSGGMRDLFQPRSIPGASGFRIANQRTTKVNVPPYPVAVRTEAFVASEITRGVPGYWDEFYVSFEPTDDISNTADQSTVVVTVERLRSSRRSLGSTSPPDEAYFNDFDSFDAEDVVTNSIVGYFTKRFRTSCLKSGKGAGRQITNCFGK